MDQVQVIDSNIKVSNLICILFSAFSKFSFDSVAIHRAQKNSFPKRRKVIREPRRILFMGAYNDRKLFDVLNGRRNGKSPLFFAQ